MKFTSISMLSLLGATMASIVPRGSNSTESLEDKTKAIGEANAGKGFEGQLEVEDKECIRPLLCCGSLTTPVDGLVDDILIDIGINGTELLGSIGLLCHAWNDSCSSPPQCCTDANILGGVLALGCSKLKS